MAASLQGRETIDVIFFDGSEADIFLRAVQENIAHGLPLSQADRRAAVERIIASHPHMSDRAISHSVGLAAKIVADIRRRSSEDLPQLNARVGRDGRVRPVDSGEGRRRAAELLAQHPEASLREWRVPWAYLRQRCLTCGNALSAATGSTGEAPGQQRGNERRRG